MDRHWTLGISAYYHDSAAVLLCDGEIIAAVQEERFTRKKNDAVFPKHSIRYVLEQGGITLQNLSAVAFYDKPYLKFERLLETYHATAPRGLRSFLKAMPVWLKEKLFLKQVLWKELKNLEQSLLEDSFIPAAFNKAKPPLLFTEHHLSHGASAFYPSPFEEAAVLTVDGVGEWATTSIGLGKGKDITVLKELRFPHSLGLFYSSFTQYCGFRVNSGEYKLMGLAPYGCDEEGDTHNKVKEYKEKILEHVIDIREDGSFLLNLSFFNFVSGLTMCHNKRWESLFGFPPRTPESSLQQEYADLALAAQQVTEEIVLSLAQTAQRLTGAKYLTLAGGVALNCVANGKLFEKKLFDDIWIQPSAGDAGGALGAAYSAYHIHMKQERVVRSKEEKPQDKMKGGYLGPAFSDRDVEQSLGSLWNKGVKEKLYSMDLNLPEADVIQKTVEFLEQGKVVGWFQGAVEWGPRALGSRSILGDPRSEVMQKKLNQKIKKRESFRPFAPAVLEEDVNQYFEGFESGQKSPYMLRVAPVTQGERTDHPKEYQGWEFREKLAYKRSSIPAVTHVDYSARVQTVGKEHHPKFRRLLECFKRRTGLGMLINTSFNVRGEPIVCKPEEAYQCFLNTDMDVLVIEGSILHKQKE